MYDACCAAAWNAERFVEKSASARTGGASKTASKIYAFKFLLVAFWGKEIVETTWTGVLKKNKGWVTWRNGTRNLLLLLTDNFNSAITIRECQNLTFVPFELYKFWRIHERANKGVSRRRGNIARCELAFNQVICEEGSKSVKISNVFWGGSSDYLNYLNIHACEWEGNIQALLFGTNMVRLPFPVAALTTSLRNWFPTGVPATRSVALTNDVRPDAVRDCAREVKADIWLEFWAGVGACARDNSGRASSNKEYMFDRRIRKRKGFEEQPNHVRWIFIWRRQLSWCFLIEEWIGKATCHQNNVIIG